MFIVTVEMTQERKDQLLDWITSDEKATDEYDAGIQAGLVWMVDKLELREHLNSEVAVTSPIVINQSLIDECKKKFEENWIRAIWNSSFALAIISVLDLFNIQIVEFPTAKRD
ncbi:hypothetical protein BVG16_32135 [Paenibacillus selenitireducens]|uniref:Uncharacterized protein n=1 Tax=Paenibacillus selenitireducens TaxID=1324314 RepID=A0A1T2WYU6_9BACL|nr:hypothetical protein [Paenibacillus selenitireducens]OPA72790.1 hypothetical protein BVG16_32135 [Paenibacillus selenitireducens]